VFGIGLPEMIVILAVALIVVGPDKLPDMARSVAKWMFELKRTVNQVKQSLTEEDDVFDSVHSDLRKAGEDLKGKLLESDHFTWQEPGGPKNAGDEAAEEEVIDVEAPSEEESDKEEGQVGESGSQGGDDAVRKPESKPEDPGQ